MTQGIKTETEIRQMIAILEAFGGPCSDLRGRHQREISALKWVLGEYPPGAPVETPIARIQEERHG